MERRAPTAAAEEIEEGRLEKARMEREDDILLAQELIIQLIISRLPGLASAALGDEEDGCLWFCDTLEEVLTTHLSKDISMISHIDGILRALLQTELVRRYALSNLAKA